MNEFFLVDEGFRIAWLWGLIPTKSFVGLRERSQVATSAILFKSDKSDMGRVGERSGLVQVVEDAYRGLVEYSEDRRSRWVVEAWMLVVHAHVERCRGSVMEFNLSVKVVCIFPSRGPSNGHVAANYRRISPYVAHLTTAGARLSDPAKPDAGTAGVRQPREARRDVISSQPENSAFQQRRGCGKGSAWRT